MVDQAEDFEHRNNNILKEGEYYYRDIASANAIDYLENYILSDYIQFKVQNTISPHSLLHVLLFAKVKVFDDLKLRNYVEGFLRYPDIHLFMLLLQKENPSSWDVLSQEL